MWRDNEEGPDCICGNPTVVKYSPTGKVLLVCLFHAAESGAVYLLPDERPDEWPDIPIEEILK